MRSSVTRRDFLKSTAAATAAASPLVALAKDENVFEVLENAARWLGTNIS